MSRNQLECTAAGTFPAGTPIDLIDVSSLLPEVLPTGGLMVNITTHADSTFSADTPLAIGWAGAAGALIASTDGLTAAGLNAGDWGKIPTTFAAPTADQTLAVTATSETTGTIHVNIYYNTF